MQTHCVAQLISLVHKTWPIRNNIIKSDFIDTFDTRRKQNGKLCQGQQCRKDCCTQSESDEDWFSFERVEHKQQSTVTEGNALSKQNRQDFNDCESLPAQHTLH